MWLLALQQRADEDNRVQNPDDGEPQINMPFRLGIFTALSDAHRIAEGGHHNEELIPPEDEVREGRPAKQPGAAGALHDMKTGPDQDRSAECKDRGRCVNWPEASEIQELQAET